MLQQTDSAKDVFIQDLRTQTTPCHKELEQNPYSVALMAHETTLNAYSTYLKKLYGFVKPYEAKVFSKVSALVPDAEGRRKTHLLESDLKALGLTEAEINALPVYDYPAPANEAQALGAMYVLEGSTLGGNIIYKRLNHLIGIDKEVNGKYFTAYGDMSGIKWKGFMEAFGEYAVSNNAEQEVINTAIATFTNMDKWLSNEA